MSLLSQWNKILKSVSIWHPRPGSEIHSSTVDSGFLQHQRHIDNQADQQISATPIISLKLCWDSFNAAVHTNPALGCIQKFNYLKAQLQGDAARAIAGLPLTERNYQHSIELIENRFGQPHKLINAHMQALLDMPNPNTSLTSLRLFYDTIATHT